MRKRLYQILEIGKSEDKESRLFDIFIISLIILNILALVVSTVSEIYLKFGSALDAFETASVAIFTLEYIGRIYSCVENPKYSKMVTGRFRYMLRPMLLVDLIAIIPFYLTALGMDLRTLRILRMVRIFRIFKLVRYVKALNNISSALKDKKAEILVAFSMIVFLILVSATLMYYAERNSQPDLFTSIPATMWWAVATLTTVGYGDIYPITGIGKTLGSLIAILGISAVAIPTAILSNAFSSIKDYKQDGGDE